MAEETDPYNLDPHFEVALVYLCCCKPKFFSRVGHEIDAEALGDSGAQLAMRISKVIAAETGNGPSSLNIVCQRLSRLTTEGKITDDQIEDVVDLFDAAEDNGLPEEEDAINEIVPILKRRMQAGAVKDAIDTYGKQGEMDEVAKTLLKSERIGVTNMSLGLSMDNAFDAITELQGLERRGCGIKELDHKMDGGAERGSLVCYVGGPGDGKSMMLVQDTCEALHQGLNVAYATLELNKARTYNRIISNLVGLPIKAVASSQMHKAKRLMSEMQDDLGMLYVEQFTPQVATIEDIQAWVKRIEEKTGEKIDVVVIDYLDKLAVEDNKEQNGYLAGRDISEKYRVWMEDEQIWGVTASQAKRKDKKQAIIDINDLADSQHKARVVDIVITLNVTEDEDGERIIKFFVAKNRNGESGFTVGPFPCDFANARIAPTIRGNRRGPRGGGGVERTPGQANLHLVE